MKVALLQSSSGDDYQANLRWLEGALDEVMGADLVVLPEMWPFLVPDARGHERRPFADRHGKDLLNKMSELSREKGMCLLSGSFFLPGLSENKVTNSSMAHLNGNEIGRYDKNHLFDNQLEGGYGESQTVEAGEKPEIFSFHDWTIGQSICYDLRFAYHFSSLREMGADLVVCPSAFTWKTGRDHWETLVRARAIENQIYMVAVNQCGRGESGVHCWGHSMLVDPWGEIVLDLGEKVGVGMAEVDREKVIGCREKMPVWSHRKSVTGR